ncbi:GerAB/ArcD/ProY family transporter [Bacillus sp. V3B]|uniref:YkvI family membrane protein n=1 Tax=Bacillus sp. V3B TaxID=2804915 RepID=UPI00210940DF|nr:GerAB/ArcD/ProY family transporter [Bacillus sp. V3B]MCQ6275075.1 GerAB/ArcD/ProY family transporter [Bacillus sp. V3B]
MKTNWGAAFQIAAVYVGTVVGAGFATGREIVEFFSRFGFIGLVGMLMSGYILIFLGSKLMIISARINAKSYEEFNEYLFGKKIGKVINLLLMLMLIGVCAVMLAGAGAIFEEQLGLSKASGVMITIALSILVMFVGIKALFAVNTFVVPLMITFSFILLVLSLKLPNFMDQLLYIPYVKDGWTAVVAPFSYTAFNLSLAQAVLVPVATEVKDERTIKRGAMLGGTALTIILIASHMTLVMLPNFELYEIPMAIIMKNLVPGLYWIFVLVIYGEIFTSVIGNVFGLEKQLKEYIALPKMIIVSGIFVVSYLLSLFEYSKLLSYLYPIFGYVSLLFIVLLWMKPENAGKK